MTWQGISARPYVKDNGSDTFVADNTELTAMSRKLDEVLAMAKWKAETAIKALRPVREAAAAIAGAAKRTAATIIPDQGQG